MKKGLFLLVFVLFVTFSANGQLIGTGTITSPYSGTLTGNLTISGTKYFDGNIIVDNEILTLTAGSKFISTSNSACIRIIGTGQLTASGTSTSTILFSADIDKDGVNGETGETWGNLYITSTGICTLRYCIIEKGKRTEVRLGYMGGGIFMSGPNITLANSIVRNCIATKGGGIYIASGYSPVISNCLFLSNSANDNGGAMYILSSSPDISNCLFRNNSSVSSTLKGGTIASISASPRIINSDILYSTSPATDGKSIYLENSTGAVIVNSLFWGGSNHIGLSGTPSSVFASCAIEGASYTGCLNLSSTNGATTGPNFTNPTTADFSIIFDSPCRDAGVSAYAGVTIPTTDYIGTKRVGNPDIGAYEMLYSLWTGSANTDWARPANWAGSYSPGTTRNIVIPTGCTNYPLLTPGPSFSLYPNLKMIIEPGARVTFNSLTNRGSIFLQSNTADRSSLMVASYFGGAGNLTINQPITGGAISQDAFRWHYIAPPATIDTTYLASIANKNLMMYDQSKVTTDISQGWQWYDGWDGTTAFATVNALSGYLVYFDKDTSIVYSDLKSLTTSIGQINLPFNGSGADSSLFGYTCVGNSLTCGINWDLVTLSDPVHVRNAIYIQAENIVASYINGVGTNGGSAHIAPLQGFMVKTTATGTYITIPNTAKEHTSVAILKSAGTIPLIRLEIQASGKKTDETVIRLESSASLSFDENFDASKIFSPAKFVPQIYTSLSGEKYSINSIPFPESQTVIPIILKIPVSGTYKISRTEMQGLGSSKAFLTDNTTNTVIDLTTIPYYTFTCESGTISNRFTLTISNKYPTKAQTITEKTLKIYQASGQVCIIPQGHEWTGENCTVKIYNLTGKLLLLATDEYFYEGERKEFGLSEPGGLIIVEVTTGNERYSEKIILNP
jgi:hypothetical protein